MGLRSDGVRVNDVVLPPWAKGKCFRINVVTVTLWLWRGLCDIVAGHCDIVAVVWPLWLWRGHYDIVAVSVAWPL